MITNKSLFITIFLAVAIVALAVFCWHGRLNINSAKQAIQQATVMRDSLAAQLTKVKSGQMRDTLRLLNAQHALHTVNGEQADAPRWQRVSQLIDKLKAQESEDGGKSIKQPMRPFAPMPAHGSVVFPELLDDPVYAKHAKEFWLGDVRTDLFLFMRAANITDADKLAEIEKVLTDARSSDMDVEGAAAALGLDTANDAVVKKLQYDIAKQKDTALQAIVGKDAYDQYDRSIMALEGYDWPGGTSFSAANLETRLSYSSEPLSETQVSQMQDLIRDEASRWHTSMSHTKARTPARMRAIRNFENSDDFNARAAQILTPAQMAGLRELQDESAATYQIIDALHAPAKQ